MENRKNQLLEILKEINLEIVSIEEPELKHERIVVQLKDLITDVNEKLINLISIKDMSNDQLLHLVSEVNKNYYSQIKNLISRYHSNPLEKYNSLIEVVQSLTNEIKRIDYLSLVGKNNVTLVGGNGVGKSSFASYMKESLSSNIVVIPAQKFLFYDKMIGSLHLTDKKLINNIQKQNLIGRGKFENNSKNDYVVQSFMADLSKIFSKLVTVVTNTQIEQEHVLVTTNSIENDSKDKTILYRLNYLWKSLIPDIVFEVDTTNRVLVPIKNGQRYSLNAMSDGEKAMLYYICQVFLAEENSFIVVDEPETFMNVSNFNRLWDTLESYRTDCKFIYISHVIDFIVTRSNADLLWCKSYDHPNDWEIENLELEEDLSNSFPKELLSEIIGVRKPILFCEGKKGSLDYLVYSKIFQEEIVVCPVEGHNQVIQYTRAYNNSPILNNNKAFGIIDADLMSQKQIDEYKEEGIFTLSFNEIEMIFFTDEIMKNMLENYFPSNEVEEKIEIFKNEFLSLVNSEKESIVQQKLKKYLDARLSKYRINKLQPSNEMLIEVKSWLDSIEIETIEQSFLTELECIIREADYDALLKVSPQKKSVSKGLANRLLDNNYEEKAKNRLKLDEELSKEIRNVYFSHIMFS
ncbi:DUF4435 domain-containing protein [Alkalibacterium olivapovliticus]|uniref:Putative AbiEii toxin of type IV toxin-antitoxin system n=1 Tax=Alkalibacterium olivapovliticus TaxID=99907 RepID=A0A2T0W8C2_9LACT|nr:DUF4435 domain-containing protein [Alkalibacterium olivapovliticus]PRY82929.1 putative AbiEii toxin of type IV toxin-antitoxin system [Alkalibacterium olivapovliticus]